MYICIDHGARSSRLCAPIRQATDIRCRLGKHFLGANNKKDAIEQFEEGLTFDGAHEESLELLAETYLGTVSRSPRSPIIIFACPPHPIINDRSLTFKQKNVCFSFTDHMNGLAHMTASNKILSPEMVAQARQG